MNQCKIPQEWIETQGEGVVVGLCDTWVDVNHPDIKDNILEMKSFSRNAIRPSAEKHGTHLAGLIVKMAPKCKLIVGIVTGYNAGRYKWLREAMQWMELKNPDVLNLSLVCKQKDDAVYNSIKNLHSKGCIITASAKDNLFPARCEEVISVGSYERDDKADLYAPLEMYSCFPIGSYGNMKGHSVSCAFATGVCACAQGYKKGLDIVKYLQNDIGENPTMPNPYNILRVK